MEQARNVRQRTSMVDSRSKELLRMLKDNTYTYQDLSRCLRSGEDVFTDDAVVGAAHAYVEEWSSMWSATRPDEAGQRVPLTAFEWAMGRGAPGERFDLWDRLEQRTEQSVTPRTLNTQLKNGKFVTVMLVKMLKERDLMGVGQQQAHDDFTTEESFVRICETMDSAYHICVHEVRLRICQPDPPSAAREDEGGGVVEGGGDEGNGGEGGGDGARAVSHCFTLYNSVNASDRFSEMHALCIEDSELTSFQSLHAHMLKLLHQRSLRKCEERLYEQVYHRTETGAMVATRAWQPASTPDFRSFLTENVSRHLTYSQYQNATGPRSNREQVVQQLIDEEEPECPTIEWNRLLVSFRNGIYHLLGAFFPFDREDEWAAIAAAKNDEWMTFSQECAERLQRRGARCRRFDLAERTLTGTGRSMLIVPPTADEASITFINEEFSPVCAQLRFDGSNFEGTEGDDDEIDAAMPWGSRLFRYLDALSTPEFDSVQHVQKFKTATRFWDLVTMGRGLLPGGSLDDLHFFPFHVGRAGTGKSLKLQTLKSFVPSERFMVLSSTAAETTFWSTGIQHAWIVAWLEAKNKGRPPVDQGTWQQMVSCETVNLPQKNKQTVIKNWDAPLFVAGNEYPNSDYWEDASGSLRRRTMTFLYDFSVTNADPSFHTRIQLNLGPLLVKMMHSYALMVMLFPTMNWLDSVPSATGGREPIIGRQMAEFQRRSQEQREPLAAFLSEPGMFVFDPSVQMLESEFVEQYNDKRMSIGLTRTKWTPAHYEVIFDMRDIKVVTTEGARGRYLRGIRLADTGVDDMR